MASIVAILLKTLLPLPVALSIAMGADTPSRPVKDFRLGGLAGSCLIVKCRIFQGVLLTQSLKAGEAARFQVQDWLLGDPTPGDTVDVPFDNNPKSDTFWAWLNAKPSTGARATVVMAVESPRGLVSTGPLVVVTFDEREGEIIRFLVAEAERLKKAPGLISVEVSSLSSGSSPALAGYLLHYVLFSTDITERGLSAELLIQMIGNPSLPSEELSTIPFFLYGYSGSLTQVGRLRMVQRFIELAQSDNDDAACAGLVGLGPVTWPGSDLMAAIPTTAKSALSVRYSALVQRKKLARDEHLESFFADR